MQSGHSIETFSDFFGKQLKLMLNKLEEEKAEFAEIEIIIDNIEKEYEKEYKEKNVLKEKDKDLTYYKHHFLDTYFLNRCTILEEEFKNLDTEKDSLKTLFMAQKPFHAIRQTLSLRVSKINETIDQLFE